MLRVMVVGLGPIGICCARAVTAQRDMQLVALVDIDPAKLGKTIFAVAGQIDPGPEDQPRVQDDLAQAAAQSKADVAIVTTASRFERVAPTLRTLLEHRIAVVSSCEEMAWPWYSQPVLAQEIDALAIKAGKALLGTGVNPGFVMDYLAVVLSSMLRRVKKVRCIRRVNAATRREPLQAKVGATMDKHEFAALAKAGKIGHMGIAESVALLAAGLGRTVAPGSVTVTLTPELAEKAVASSLGLIEPGRVCGMRNVARWEGDGLTIELDLTMKVGMEDPKDVIEISGPVNLALKIPGGVPGDSATTAALLNHCYGIVHVRPGLRTMLDMPAAGSRGGDA